MSLSLRIEVWAASLWWPVVKRLRAMRRYLRGKWVSAKLKRALRRKPFARSIDTHFAYVAGLAAEEDRVNPLPARWESDGPVISFVVPVYNTKIRYLDDLLESFRRQPRRYCELILSDDGSASPWTKAWLDAHGSVPGLTIVRNAENKGIASATNAGIARAAGEWVGLVDHDDALAPYAVSRLVRALTAEPQCRFLYTDEAIVDENLRAVDYFLKPAWDPVLLSGVNYVNHLSLYRRDRLLEIGGLRDGFQGSQDYDLVLRYTRGLSGDEIVHLPYPAYIWRRGAATFTARFLQTATGNARKALGEHYARDGRPAIVDNGVKTDRHRVRFDKARTEWPPVSVIVPNRNSFRLMSSLLDGLTRATDYPVLDIIVVDNGSTDADVLALYERYRSGATAFRAVITNEPFNFSRSINRGVAMARGSHILLLNNDIEILDSAWLKEMVSCFDYPATGIVGAKLLYPDRTIQHVGVIAGLSDLAGHWHIGRPEDFPGSMGRLWTRQSLSVVTGACMLVSRECFAAVGAFDEEVFPIAYNDVDFCLRARNKGFRVVWTPFAKLIHHESASRGSDETPENIERFNRDKRSLRERHHTDLFEDPAFNPWYSRHHRDFPPAFLPHLPGARSCYKTPAHLV